MKSIIIDTSSAILLFKSGLIALLVKNYNTLVAHSVYNELTQHGYPGAADIKQLCECGRIKVLKQIHPKPDCQESFPALPVLNSGERETLQQQMGGVGDFIIIDDGRAVKYCLKASLPFINALLFPRILLMVKAISASEYHQKKAEIIQYGHYSEGIVEMAQNLSDRAIQPFLPTH